MYPGLPDGVNQIYDGTFSGTLIEGRGVFADLLVKNGIKVLDLEDLEKGIPAIDNIFLGGELK